MERELEQASLSAWPAVEETGMEGWQLRHSFGFSKRANSVQPLGSAATSLDEQVSRCEAWYEERGRPCIFRLTPLSDPTLDGFLAERGYQLLDRTAVLQRMTGPPEALPAGIELRPTELEPWLTAYARMTALPEGAPPALRAILQSMTAERTLATLWSEAEGEVVACGIAARERGLVGLFDLVTAPEHRRKGYGVHLVRALLRWGARRRAKRAYLQVVRSNAAAWALYEKLGFEWVYDYWYRVRPAP